jgi:Lysyl oxidase
MRLVRWKPACAIMAGTAVTVAGAIVPGSTVAGAANATGPVVKLLVAQRAITVGVHHRHVFLDPGIWVGSLGSPLEFDVGRQTYSSPITISQVTHTPAGGITRTRWPGSVLDGWNGLADFVHLTVLNSAGKVVATRRATFCPNAFDPARVIPDSPGSSPYPQQCASSPFEKGMVWGIQADWAVEPIEFIGLRLSAGTYNVTETISAKYVSLLHIPATDATATVSVKVSNNAPCCFFGPRRRASARTASRTGQAVSSLAGSRQAVMAPAIPRLARPPQDALPDLVALPSSGIRTSHTRSGLDLLSFGATVWIGGNSPLDVEGFRSDGSPVMPAYQYFWSNGQVIGKARAGTMGFDSRPGHDHWHFQQFAQYQLLTKNKKLAVRSHKQGFCIAPTDPIDLLLLHAEWQPTFDFGGRCGSPSALWVREMLPVGWGDTYFQSVAGQSFNITHVPNGTYYIEVIANPEKVLYETTTRNDVSLRKVILGGRPGHRTVRVPAFHGIDPER